MHRDEALIDNRGFVSRRAVNITEGPPPHGAHAEGVEIPGADSEERDIGWLFAGRRRAPIDRQLSEQTAEHWRVGRDRARLNGGNLAQPFFELLVERDARLAPRVLRERQ